MAPKFGTSGLRGLVVDLTEDLVSDYVRAFIAACDCRGSLFVGHDLRPSSPQIADFVVSAARAEGLKVFTCGATPTPALALASIEASAGAIMITGSHIPADRNGLKFYVPNGEISKNDEQAITANLGRASNKASPLPVVTTDALKPYENRYATAFGSDCLTGLRIGVYQHSAVGRDVLVNIFNSLGATVVALGRSDAFIPVDTEALDPNTGALLADWCSQHRLDAVVSTDGDSDRPMLADQHGQVIAGDILGVLTAQYLGADVICTPVSSNSMVLQMPEFQTVTLTQIGSPFVIDAMEKHQVDVATTKVAGFEANGGFLLGYIAQTRGGTLSPLMTRDSVLPILAPLISAHEKGQSIQDALAALPQVFTAADRLQNIPLSISTPFLEKLTTSPALRADFFGMAENETTIDITDGLRITFASGNVVHIRPSGNAPELRCYAEANTRAKAKALADRTLEKISEILG